MSTDTKPISRPLTLAAMQSTARPNESADAALRVKPGRELWIELQPDKTLESTFARLGHAAPQAWFVADGIDGDDKSWRATLLDVECVVTGAGRQIAMPRGSVLIRGASGLAYIVHRVVFASQFHRGLADGQKICPLDAALGEQAKALAGLGQRITAESNRLRSNSWFKRLLHPLAHRRDSRRMSEASQQVGEHIAHMRYQRVCAGSGVADSGAV